MSDNKKISISTRLLHNNFLIILISIALVTSGLGTWYTPALAQQQDPYRNAVFSFTVVFPDISIVGSGFPKNDAFYVRVRGNINQPFVRIGTIRSKQDGTMFETFTLTEDMRDSTHFTVCLKNISNDRVICSGVGTLVFIKTNACEPGPPINYMKNRSGFNGVRISPPEGEDFIFGLELYEYNYEWQY